MTPETPRDPLRVTEDGLHLPEGFSDHTGMFTARTPTATVQFGGGPLSFRTVFPMIRPEFWTERPDEDPVTNPKALPASVGLKRHGIDESTHWYPVTFEQEEEGDNENEAVEETNS